VGLIIPESMYTDPVGRGHIRQLGIYSDKLIPGLKRMADAVHQHGAKIASELMYTGRETSSYITGFQPVAPSPVACKVLAGGEAPRELTKDEIKKLIDDYGEAARRSVEAGFDLVEIHVPMAISSVSSCLPLPINGRTSMEAPLRTACVFPWRSSRG